MKFPAVLTPILHRRLACLTLIGVAAYLVRANLLGNSPWRCGFRAATGLPCPGCGLTRSLAALVRGHWREAFAWHVGAPFIALGLLLMLIATLLRGPARQRLLITVERLEHRTGVAWFFIAALLIYAIWRAATGTFPG